MCVCVCVCVCVRWGEAFASERVMSSNLTRCHTTAAPYDSENQIFSFCEESLYFANFGEKILTTGGTLRAAGILLLGRDSLRQVWHLQLCLWVLLVRPTALAHPQHLRTTRRPLLTVTCSLATNIWCNLASSFCSLHAVWITQAEGRDSQSLVKFGRLVNFSDSSLRALQCGDTE